MELFYKDIVGLHAGKTACVMGHGPSLTPYLDIFNKLQHKEEIITFECNDWFNFFEGPPTYWLFANHEHAIEDGIKNEKMWRTYKFPPDVIQTANTTILYADSVDFSGKEYIRQNLIPNFLAYDQRHFKAHSCLQILKNFKKHAIEKKNFDYKYYGNNSVMWAPPRRNAGAGFSGGLSGGPTGAGRCCQQRIEGRLTIQEKLQQISGHTEHYSTGDTAALHMIAFAILMGCNPIYVAGMDLDYSLGYAVESPALNHMYNFVRHNTDWKTSRANMRNDLKIIDESAKLCGLKIINLAKNAWYNELQKGDFLQ